MSNILVIENQQYEYTRIVKRLDEEGYAEVYPKEEEFSNFIEKIHVIINKQYKRDYRKKSLENLVNYIERNNIKIILMDHILGGAYHCHTGIDLANEVNKERLEKNNVIPVIFLSKTELNEKKRLEGNHSDIETEYSLMDNNSSLMGYNQYEKKYSNQYTRWIHKGYFGDECLEEGYFKKYISKEIEKSLGSSENENFQRKLTSVIELGYPGNQECKKNKLNKILEEKNYEELSISFKEMIDKVYYSKNINELCLNIIENELKGKS